MAQDIHFTQYYFSPLNVNPAYIGNFDGDFRIVGNHRSQWGAIIDDQFITSGVSFDQNLEVHNHHIAVGGSFVHDQSSVGYLNQNKLQLGGSYKKYFKGHTLIAGLQLGMIHKGIDFTKFTYPSQFDMDNGFFSAGLSNMENFENSNDYLLDVNVGVSWSKQLTEKIIPRVGFTMMHLNTPKETFLNDVDNRLKIRNVLDVSVDYLLNPIVTITPNFLFMSQNKAQELVWGGLLRYKLGTNKYELLNVFCGISSRNGFGRNYDAFNMIVGAKIKEYQIGLSYDLNASELTSITHYRGAFEISLIYIAKNTKPKIYNVPCDRL